ncbi:Cell death protease, partial [Elasticomyces elasticus]
MRRFRRLLPWTVLLSTACLPSISTAAKTAADYFVHSLPGAPQPLLKMHAGHIEVSPEHDGNMFFWHYENRHIANKQRTVIWLNGGPGCSSMDGALMEIGPYRVNEGGETLRYNDGSWDEFANVMFVDNPVGTGFSYVDTDSYLHELKDMADQFVIFLEKWFDLFPEYSHDDVRLELPGSLSESYAGQHIPHIARAILDRNADKSKPLWNLAGLLIGNGWISGPEQYLAYLEFAYKEDLIQAGTVAANQVEAQQATCIKDLDAGGKDHVDVLSCENVLQEILRVTQDGNKQCLNMYDVRLRDSFPSCGMNWPPDLEYVDPYLHRQDVVNALHVDPDKRTGWRECNDQVGRAFRARNSTPSVKLLPDILQTVPIILFSGDKDMICNHIGTEELINNLSWNGGKGFETSPGVRAPRRDWTFEGEPAGIYQSARNLT